MDDGTAYTFGQYNEVLVAVVKALPKALENTDPKKLLASLEGRGVVLEQLLGEALSLISADVPADEEWFDLEVDYDVDPLKVVRSAGYNPEGWKFLGPARKGKVVEQTKLIRLGHVRTVEEAERRADEREYRLLGGHGRESFKAKYPKPDGKGPIVFAGSRWQPPYGRALVACLFGLGDEWGSHFRWADGEFSEDCRWPVVRK
jgi:hypothetical protein